jgi:hypothetical protein
MSLGAKRPDWTGLLNTTDAVSQLRSQLSTLMLDQKSQLVDELGVLEDFPSAQGDA